MKTGKYNIRDLFNNRYIEQIIIPEIQRDYVWGEEQVNGLLTSILKDFKKFNSSELALPETMEEELKADFLDYYRGKVHASNIGFIYAYTDHEYAGKYFLIDGQQRITTIYLLLLALMNRNGLQKEFREFYQQGSRLKLDYRVREAAHEFIPNFVKFILDNGNDPEDEVWFHREYLHDQSIRSVIENYEVILSFLSAKSIKEKDFLEYVQEHVEFWYFDTNISEQGEELYIYMNARGEQMQSNENLKADLLGDLRPAEKDECGRLWENWQDLFWLNRADNANADKGFNEFLKCIAGLENFLSGKKNFYSVEDFNDKKRGDARNISYPDLKAPLTFKRLRQFINALEYIIDHQTEFAEQYAYSAWLDDCIEELWTILNDETTNWFADYGDANRGIERSRMVFLWSIFHYITLVKDIDPDELFRVLRCYYLRYHNYNRSVSKIPKEISAIMATGVWGTGGTEISDEEDNDEELQKHSWLRSLPAESIRDYESLLWEIEDHPYNIDGRDLKNINSSHLVSYKQDPDLKQLRYIKDRFYALFPLKKNDRALERLQTILIFYGEFWQIQTPYYYQNLGFSEWERIVRDLDGDKKTFRAFFRDWKKQPDKSLEDWLNEVAAISDVPVSEQDLHRQLKWYASHLRTAMWEKGGNIALRDWVPHDKIFRHSPKFFNTRGNMRGSDQQELALLLPKEVRRQVKSN